MNKSRYRRKLSYFGYMKNQKCGRCFHDGAAHFWWDPMFGTEESVLGCKSCREEICQDRGVQQSMSAVNLCERCGSLMLGKAVAYITFSGSREEKDETQELCPACFGAFMDFLHSATEPAQRAPFREPWKPAQGKSESLLMLENGYCGAKKENDVGVITGMCLRAKGHDMPHRDGEMEWTA